MIARLKGEWEDEYKLWQKRDLSARRYVYVWADGVYLQARMEPQAECMLVLIGATPEGKKELLGFRTGMRESAQSWKELLVDLKARGLSIAPEIAVGDGALGFWRALDEAFPSTRHQRCWQHKTLNVLDKLPKSVQPNAHQDLREIWLSPNRAAAEAAMAIFAEKYAPKYQKAVDCLLKDRDALLTFFDFPAEHWTHLRTSNPIESAFATVRHRTVRMKGALSQDTARLMVFKLVMAASKSWRRLQGQNQLPKVVSGVTFRDGIEVASEKKSAAEFMPSPKILRSSGRHGGCQPGARGFDPHRRLVQQSSQGGICRLLCRRAGNRNKRLRPSSSREHGNSNCGLDGKLIGTVPTGSRRDVSFDAVNWLHWRLEVTKRRIASAWEGIVARL